MVKSFKIKTPYDLAAYSAIKSKKVFGLGNNFTMGDLSEELNKGVINYRYDQFVQCWTIIWMLIF